jgi:hypothetical protein
MDVDRCPDCGWPTVKGRPCLRCSPGSRPDREEGGSTSTDAGRRWSRLAPRASATSAAADAAVTAIITLLVFLGLFWITLGMLLFRAVVTHRGGDLSFLAVIVGGWNLLMGGYILSAIRAVLRRRLTAAGQLVLISLGGAAWAVFAAIWFGGDFQLLAVPIHLALGILAWIASRRFGLASN